MSLPDTPRVVASRGLAPSSLCRGVEALFFYVRKAALFGRCKLQVRREGGERRRREAYVRSRV